MCASIFISSTFQKGNFREPWFVLKPKFRCLKHSLGVRYASTRFAGNGKQGCSVQLHVHADRRQGRRRLALTPGQATARRTNESWCSTSRHASLGQSPPSGDIAIGGRLLAGKPPALGEGGVDRAYKALPAPPRPPSTNLQQEKGVV